MEIIVSVRDRYNTYTATFGSKRRASCTGGAQQAVERLAVKVFGELQRVTVAEVSRADGVANWRITTDPAQACRVCGCTWDNACENGCSWVEADLCSGCALWRRIS
jgi:hypothetical protein